MKILEIKNLKKNFGGLTALHDLSLEVEEGEIFGIAGPNGSGKSTLFNVISGVYHGDGDIIFNKEKINRLRSHQICRKGIARTFQTPQLFSTLSVIENIKVGVLFSLKRKGLKGDNILEDVISFMKLEGRKDDATTSLNLYDQKKTMIAAALATRPRLLLVDEPTGGLGPAEQDNLTTLFKKINVDFNITILIIEHRMKVLSELCSRLMILENGLNICIGTPQAVGKDERVCKVYLGDNHA